MLDKKPWHYHQSSLCGVQWGWGHGSVQAFCTLLHAKVSFHAGTGMNSLVLTMDSFAIVQGVHRGVMNRSLHMFDHKVCIQALAISTMNSKYMWDHKLASHCLSLINEIRSLLILFKTADTFSMDWVIK